MPESGWLKPPDARKWHYFQDSIISICGDWAFAGYPVAEADGAKCKKCVRRMERKGDG